MMELTQTHLRYLLAIYDLAQTTPGVSAGDVSKVLAVSKPSVTRMMGLLMERGLLVRERYGKVFLTGKNGTAAGADSQDGIVPERRGTGRHGLSPGSGASGACHQCEIESPTDGGSGKGLLKESECVICRPCPRCMPRKE